MIKIYLFIFLFICKSLLVDAQNIQLTAPSGSEKFGTQVTVLTNGNYVVSDPKFDDNGNPDVGAIYLYNGKTHTLISTLKGASANDHIGEKWTILPLSNGNFIVLSSNWDNGSITDAGALTWVNGVTGLNSVISSSNSLVGTHSGDLLDARIQIPLSTGNIFLISRNWDNGSIVNAGAITWIDISTGITGQVSASNSLVGTQANDFSYASIKPGQNGNVLIISPYWDNASLIDAGAITWVNGSIGISGTISSSNSLIGGNANDQIGYNNNGDSDVSLSNGNFVVGAPYWDNGALQDVGAAIWINGTTGTTGVVSSSNSLIGGKADDKAGQNIIYLSNGNYVCATSSWDRGSIIDAGAVTFCNGTTGRFGLITTANSLTGTKNNDQVGNRVEGLKNGNYVVGSRNWSNGAITNVGAVTFANGTTGLIGVVATTNSLIGVSAYDQVGSNITALENNNYVVTSPSWDNGSLTDVGAITICNGTTSTVGTVSITNSIVGTTSGDVIGTNFGFPRIGTFTNGDFIIGSSSWDNGAIINAGAVTIFNGTPSLTGTITVANSLVGTHSNDEIGSKEIYVDHTTQNILVFSPKWDNGAIMDAGATTFINKNIGLTGAVSTTNSLVGSTTNDQIGKGGGSIFENGNFVINCPNWDDNGKVDVGAIVWNDWRNPIYGTINSSNALIGNAANDQLGDAYFDDFANGQSLYTSPYWDNGAIIDAGATTPFYETTPTTGYINSCNSIIENNATEGINLYPEYNNKYNYALLGSPNFNKVIIKYRSHFALANHLDEKQIYLAGNKEADVITDQDCRIIYSVKPNGTNPIYGDVSSKVWIDLIQNSIHVKRHFEITPVNNASVATGRITLYFTQSEFDDFNNVNSIKLPSGPNDANGINNLFIEKRAGISNDGSGSLNSYTGTVTTIDPNDADIVWNAIVNRWEVSFEVTGFSGFFVKARPGALSAQSILLTGENNQTFNSLHWVVANIQNIKSFFLERSIDGINFEKITEVFHNGNTDYRYKDITTASQCYYRIKVIKLSNETINSNAIYLSNTSQYSIKVYPTIVKDIVIIQVGHKMIGKVIKLFNSNGQIIKSHVINSNKEIISMENESSGYYILSIDGNHSFKVIKQ